MSMLAAALPALCFAALLKRENFRESFLISAVVNALFVAASTEILSLFHALAFPQLVACWTLFLVAVAASVYRGPDRRFKAPVAPAPRLTPFQLVLIALIAAVVALTGITAVVAAPNNFDSLTYHLPRIMHWTQNRCVEHYPTHIDRQLVLAPFSEYVMMHLRLLAGSDRFLNCVQWFALVGSAAGVSLIVRELKGSINSQIVAAAVALTVPMGLLQATSTQNDYAATFWLVCLVYSVVRSWHGRDARDALLVGATLALAIFTKGTAYLVAFPFMLVYAGRALTGNWKSGAAKLAVVALAVLVVNSGHFARNIRVYGNPISPGTGNSIVATKYGVTAIVSSVTKNVATQLTSGVPAADRSLSHLIRIVHHSIGADPGDPELNADGRFALLPAKLHEDLAPNPVHMVLMLLAALALAAGWKRHSPELLVFAAAGIMSFVALSVGIKWNPFISRYFLPVLVIAAPFVALSLDRVKLQPLVNAGAVLLLAGAFLILAKNEMRPLAGPNSVFATSRIDQYFRSRPQAQPYFQAVAGMVKGQPATNVGILNRDGNMQEYLLWVLLEGDGRSYRIEHVEVENASGGIKLQGFNGFIPVTI